METRRSLRISRFQRQRKSKKQRGAQRPRRIQGCEWRVWEPGAACVEARESLTVKGSTDASGSFVEARSSSTARSRGIMEARGVIDGAKEGVAPTISVQTGT